MSAPVPGPRLEVEGQVVVEGGSRVEVEGWSPREVEGSWWRTFAYWWALSPALLADEPVVRELREVVVLGVQEEAGKLAAWCPGPVEISVFHSNHGDLFTRNLSGMILGEVRGLALLTPDPFPVIVISPAALELERRARAMARRIRRVFQERG